MRLESLAWGPSDGPLAVLLHGFPDTAHTWRHLGPTLADRGWRVVAPFLRGYAPSDLAPDGGYEIAALGADLLELKQAHGGDDRTIVVGHDWGALATYAAVCHDPGAFARVITMAVPPVEALARAVKAAPWRLPAQLRRSWYVVAAQVPGAGERLVRRALPRIWRDWSPGYDASADLAMVRLALPDEPRWSAALGYYRATGRRDLQRPAYDEMRASSQAIPAVPLLYLHGDRDGAMGVALARAAATHLAPGSRYEELLGAGHFLHLEQPDRVAELVLAHLD